MDPLKTAAPSESRLHFLDYWRIIRIRKTVILAVFLLVVVTATIVTYMLPLRYSSKATMKIDKDASDVASLVGAPNSGIYDPYFIQTEFQVIQSAAVLDRVIEQLNLNHRWAEKYGSPTDLKDSESRPILKNNLELSPYRNTSLIIVTAFSDSPQEAAEIANKVVSVYQDYRQRMVQGRTEGGINAFAKELDEENIKVKDQEQKVDHLRTELKVTDLNPQATGSGSMGPESVQQYNSIGIQAEHELILEKQTVEGLRALTPEKRREAITTALLSPDQELTQLMQELVMTQIKLTTLKNDLGDENPEVIRNSKLAEDLNQKIENRVDGILNGLEVKVSKLEAVVKNSKEKVEEARATDIENSEKFRPYFVAKEELDQLKKERDLLMLRKFQEQTDIKMPRGSMVQPIEPAEPNKHPVRPNKPLNIALGIVIGLVVGVGLAFFIEYLDTSVKTIDDVERTLQAPVLGVIPQNVGYLLDEGAESPHAEAYRVLRTNLLFSRKNDKLNTVAVVSAGAGEGKSTTVCNLATVFAQSGQTVVMVDSDLRRPTLHKIMGVANTLGLTNYLMKQNSLDEVIQVSKLPNLHFMSSGKLPSSSLGILSSSQMKDLITELKKRYDFVFFDSPPIMGVSDASILASEVDMTMQVIQYRRYPQPMNIRAKQLIEKVGGNLIGIVLNNINMSQDENYYYYSGYYHDYYSKNEEEAAASPNGVDKPRVDVKNKF